MADESRGGGVKLAVLLVLLTGVVAAVVCLAPICDCPCRTGGVAEINPGISRLTCSVCWGRGRVTPKKKLEAALTGRPPVFVPAK